MERNKWYVINTTNEKHMVVWRVRNEEAKIVCEAYIIRNDLEFELEVESIYEISGLTDSKLIGMTEFILACN